MVHERKLVLGRDLVQKIQSYLAELEGVGKERRTLTTARIQRQRKEKTEDIIQFDAAFDANRGILQAIKLGILLGLRSVTVMGDSKTVIKKCQATDMDKLIIGAVIRDIQSYSSRFQEIIFQFVQKLENFQAHKLAKEALAKGEERYLVRDELICNEGALEEEWSRNPD
ncbi:hypothetical protein Gogos_021027 [Gossypium gossypioides]|uniref:RNase H type-1 domain-containing protein n=1 Tax=Gossypium gossypioides TaxID=34282 RepID=A0A7J9D6F0_GOSGO|nr:hypothetical protein [Gossypium gossypioides]